MKVLVTGANGFVGTAVCRRLLAEGWGVAGAVRRDAPLPPGVEPRRVEPLAPHTPWSKALHGIDAVVHLAARVHVMRDHAADPAAAFRAANTEASLHLAREAAKAGVARFVFMSSIKAMGEASRGRALTLDDAPEPVDPYGESKWETERGLAQLAATALMHTTILRPPLVYGPGVRGNFLALLKAVDRGWPLPLGSVENRRSLLFVENLADAVAVALREPAGACETFLLSDGEDISTPDLVRHLGRLMTRPARLWNVPPALMEAAATLVGRRAAARRLIDSLQVDGSAFRRRFDWTPPFTLEQGLTETFAWFRTRPR